MSGTAELLPPPETSPWDQALDDWDRFLRITADLCAGKMVQCLAEDDVSSALEYSGYHSRLVWMRSQLFLMGSPRRRMIRVMQLGGAVATVSYALARR